MDEKNQSEKQETKSIYPQANAVTLDIQAPDQVTKENTLETVLSKLGINKQKNPPVTDKSANKGLTPKKREFVTTFAPVVSLAFVMLATWVWSRQGQQYKILAPSDEVAAQIVTPLVRIYARLTTLETGINPNIVDVSTSILALMGYIFSSYALYKQIHESEKDNYGQFDTREVRSSDGSYFFNNGRENTSYGEITPETTANTTRPERTLTDREQRQHNALAKLNEMDYYNRLRRANKL